MGKVWALALVVLGGLATANPADAAGIERLRLEFVEECDGLNLLIFPRLGVIGLHTGCGNNELVFGSTFTTSNFEDGLEVFYLDTNSFLFQRVELYRTGFRANRYYKYLPVSGLLIVTGQWVEINP